jgi:putative membrane protein
MSCPRHVNLDSGLLMVVIGLVSLLVATFEYRANIRTLGPEYPKRARPLSLIVAALVALLGVLALITMAMRM